MADRLRRCRASLLLGAALGFAAGVVVRSELQRRLRRLSKGAAR